MGGREEGLRGGPPWHFSLPLPAMLIALHKPYDVLSQFTPELPGQRGEFHGIHGAGGAQEVLPGEEAYPSIVAPLFGA